MTELLTSILTDAETIAAATRIVPVVDPLLANDQLLRKVSAAAASSASDLGTATANAAADKTDPFTALFKQRDENRDNAFTAARDFAGAFTNLPAGPQRDAGDLLISIFRKHGYSLHREGYTAQTGKAQGLIAEMDGAEPTAAWATIAGTAFYQGIKDTQAAFEELVEQRTEARKGETPAPTVKESRRGLTVSLNYLLDGVALWEELDNGETPELAGAIESLDQIIEDIMGPALARRSKESSEAAGDEGGTG